MKEYLDVLTDIYFSGEARPDRTGVGVYSVFAPREMKFLFADGFPIVTTKRMAWKSIVWELLWFLNGRTDNKWLRDRGVSIWNAWEKKDSSDLGPIYGSQWRNWNGIDQIETLIANLKEDPMSRRHVVSTWNVSDLPKMALAPCHVMFQVYCDTNNGISMKLTQRSGDMFLGVPFNISSYALLLSIIAKIVGKTPRTLVVSLGDAHIYQNHSMQVREQMLRAPFSRPKLVFPNIQSLKDACSLTADDFVLIDYLHHEAIKGEVAV